MNTQTNILNSLGFHGSYKPSDVTFLLQLTDLEPTDVAEKEKMIQSGTKHYSQMISAEKAPSHKHIHLYTNALQDYKKRFALEVQKLALALKETHPSEIVFVSLVRAGVPLGVLLHRAAKDQGVVSHHYGISIIRDRGIDFAALEAIIKTHGHENIVFVDGWTGKGAISKELYKNLKDDSRFPTEDEVVRLVTLADLSGYAWLTASSDDWLIPSGVLGSVVSGLISRSILIDDIDKKIAQENCFDVSNWHSCIKYECLNEHDLSQSFIEIIDSERKALGSRNIDKAVWTSEERLSTRKKAIATINDLATKHQITNLNRIKPGIAEATRAVLRRVPDLILLEQPNDPDCRLIEMLSKDVGAPMEVVGNEVAPYKVITLIKKTS